jgi:hypothetical protein
MPDLAVNQIIQTRLEWELYGQKDLTVWHWVVKDVTGSIDAFPWLSGVFHPWLMSPTGAVMDMLGNLSSDLTLNAVVSQLIRPVRYRPIRTVVNEFGGDATPAGTNNAAVSIGFGGPLAGRGRMGRSQIPGVPKKWMTNAKWDEGVVDLIRDALATIRVGPQAIAGSPVQFEPVIYSSKFLTWQEIETIEPHYTVRTMRRRTFGVGQ